MTTILVKKKKEKCVYRTWMYTLPAITNRTYPQDRKSGKVGNR